MKRRRYGPIYAGGRVEYGPDNETYTVFPDGTEVKAIPVDGPEHRARAASLGYRSLEEMAHWHDGTHLLVAQLLACGSEQPESPTLKAVSEDRLASMPEWLIQGEENMNFALARWINDGTPNEWLAPFVLAGHDLYAVRDQMRFLMAKERAHRKKASGV